jgi:hypothetical protein
LYNQSNRKKKFLEGCIEQQPDLELQEQLKQTCGAYCALKADRSHRDNDQKLNKQRTPLPNRYAIIYKRSGIWPLLHGIMSERLGAEQASRMLAILGVELKSV